MMAEKLEVFPNAKRKHPWDEWLNGEVWALSANEDFSGRVIPMRTQVYAAAKARDLRVRSRIKNGKLIVQAYTPNGTDGT